MIQWLLMCAMAALGALGPAGRARTIHVNGTTGDDAWDGLCETWDGGTCGPKATIQAGIDAAVDGDVVLLADGTYMGAGNKDLDFAGKSITVRSASDDPATCVIDCEGSGRGFHFHSGETAASVVQGLTIRAGAQYHGGGVYCEHASPTLVNCTISGNRADWAGGGLHCYYSSPTLIHCTISGSTSGYTGGGVSCGWYSAPTLTNCTISANTAAMGGGGVYCDTGDPTLSHCTISGNAAWAGGGIYCASNPTLANCTVSVNAADYGGGVYCDTGNATMTHCTFSGNTAELQGAGLSCESSHPTLTNCTIAGNIVHWEGGGLYCNASSPALTNCTIAGNVADRDGAGVDCESSSPTLTNCTITGNVAKWAAGALSADASSSTLTNCILWGNRREEIHVSGGSVAVTYCDIRGGWHGPGNIDADPRFADPASANFHLSPGSPCIDAAHNAYVPPDWLDLDADGDTTEPIPFDLAGRPRFIDDPATADTGHGTPPIVDMGAYEFQVRGDLNCDGQVDAFDVDPFVLALTDPAGYQAKYPDCDAKLADINGDGKVDAFDIDPFVKILTGR